MAQRPYSFALRGGLELETQPNLIDPGRILSCKNYESVTAGSTRAGGYRRIKGFERQDSLATLPSEMFYAYVYFDFGAIEPSIGQVIEGATSLQTGKLLSIVLSSGSWVGSDAAGYLVIAIEPGFSSFVDNENIKLDATLYALANGDSDIDPEQDEATREIHIRAAREDQRSRITQPAGAGGVKGVFKFKNANDQVVLYAFRNNVGNTAVVLHEAVGASGWQAVDIGFYIDFTSGSIEPLIDATLTGQTSAATGVVVGVGLDSGSWTGGDAAGRVYLKSLSGTFQSELINNTSTAATDVLTGGGGQTVNTFNVNGFFRFILSNFNGNFNQKVYGCDGVNRAFVFDGNGLAFIHSGLQLSEDKPKYIHEHKNHLFLAVAKSIYNSSIGNPLSYDAVTGAAIISIGNEVTGFSAEPGGILSVFGTSEIHFLYGSGASSWDLKRHSSLRGAIPSTIQDMTGTVYLDNRGISRITTTQDFGDFKAGSISRNIRPLNLVKKGLVTTSIVVDTKDQYRVFFSDNSFIIASFDERGRPEYTLCEFDRSVDTCFSYKPESGDQEEVFFGSSDGYVYRMDSGQSFDGAIIDYSIRLAYCDMGSPRNKKRFFKTIIDIDSPPNPTLSFIPEMSYGGAEQPVSREYIAGTDVDVLTGGGYYGEDSWGVFYWDAQSIGQIEGYVDGSGINISLLIAGESNYEAEHTLLGVTYHYSVRGMKR